MSLNITLTLCLRFLKEYILDNDISYYQIRVIDCKTPRKEYVAVKHEKNCLKIYYRRARYASLFETYERAKQIVEAYLTGVNCEIIGWYMR